MSILKKYLTLNIFFLIILSIETKKINWKNLSIEIFKENNFSIFGYLKYKINETHFLYLKHKNFHIDTLNRFCYHMNFDNFYSFSMSTTKYPSIQSVEFYEDRDYFE